MCFTCVRFATFTIQAITAAVHVIIYVPTIPIPASILRLLPVAELPVPMVLITVTTTILHRIPDPLPTSGWWTTDRTHTAIIAIQVAGIPFIPVSAKWIPARDGSCPKYRPASANRYDWAACTGHIFVRQCLTTSPWIPTCRIFCCSNTPVCSTIPATPTISSRVLCSKSSTRRVIWWMPAAAPPISIRATPRRIPPDGIRASATAYIGKTGPPWDSIWQLTKDRQSRCGYRASLAGKEHQRILDMLITLSRVPKLKSAQAPVPWANRQRYRLHWGSTTVGTQPTTHPLPCPQTGRSA